jgi:phosphoglycolate phosphatase-like HAD superfamily hydrolase
MGDMQTKILLFDFDGTIADTANAAVRIYNQIAKENNYKLISKGNLTKLRNMRAMDNIHYMGVPLLKLPFLGKKVREIFKNEIPNLKAIKGISEPLQKLKNKGYILNIVSSNSKENILSFLERNNISFFDDVFSVSNLFGKHRKIKNLVKENNWDSSEVVYIGDEVRDIEAARKANIKSVAVSWGYNSQEVLAKNSPDMLFSNPSELSSL